MLGQSTTKRSNTSTQSPPEFGDDAHGMLPFAQQGAVFLIGRNPSAEGTQDDGSVRRGSWFVPAGSR